jgi:hypothetical protein
MASYALVFDVPEQERYDRVHIAIRLVVFIILGVIGSILGLIYLAVPVYGAIQISQKGAARYLAESEQNITKWLRWLAGAASYLFLLTDTFPTDEKPHAVRFDVTPSGEPTAGGVLLRIITAIPHAIVLGLIGIVTFVLLIIAAIMVLISEKYPAGIFAFIRGDLRWNARMYVWMAGLTQEYPPFSFDTGPEGPEPVMAGVAPASPPPSSTTGAQP